MKWPKVKLEDCCEVISGATPKTGVEDFWDGEIRWATPKDLSDLDSIYIEDTPRKITAAGLRSCAATVLPPGSVLLSSRAPIGYVAINTQPMATNQGFKSLVPNKELVSAEYLAWWLKANRSYLEGLGNGATFKEVSKATISKVEIPLPPVAEQKQIAATLNAVDALHAKRRKAITLLDTLAQSVFLEMFGDPVHGTVISARQRISQIARVQTGPFGSLLHHEDYQEGGIPLVNPMHIIDGRIIADIRHSVSPAKAESLDSYRLRELDIVMGRRGEMGRCALVDQHSEGFLCGTGSLIIRPDTAVVNPVFLATVLSHASMKHYLEECSLGTTMFNLNQKIVGAVQIPDPPLFLQQEFAKRVDAIETEEAKHRESLAKLDDLFAAVQGRAFAGTLFG